MYPIWLPQKACNLLEVDQRGQVSVINALAVPFSTAAVKMGCYMLVIVGIDIDLPR